MDTHPRFVGFEVVRLQEAHVIGGNHGHAAPGRERYSGGNVVFLAGPTEPLQLDVEPVAEQCEPRNRELARRPFRARSVSARPISPSAAHESAIRPVDVLRT